MKNEITKIIAQQKSGIYSFKLKPASAKIIDTVQQPNIKR